MSAPHPRAVGTYGPEVEAFSAEQLRLEPRWWQRLALRRILEHDAAGELVWLVWIATCPRQVGKSWLLRMLLLWRIHQAERFGEPQLVLHTGKDLNVCHEVQRPARAWARARGYKVRETNGQEEIESPEGSRWMIRGRDSLFGYSASLAAVDEAWHVSAEVVEDGLEPTMAERRDPQLGLVSTAHRMATPLVPIRRADAIAHLADPSEVLLIEWSAPRTAELGSVADWRRASPHWSDKRERLVATNHARAMSATVSEDPDEPDPRESFRSQWLNVWPERGIASGRDEPLLAEDAWSARADLTATAEGPLALAVDDYYGHGAAVVAAGRTASGHTLVWGQLAARRSAALAWLGSLAAAHPGSTLLVGPALVDSVELHQISATASAATAAQLRSGLALIRELTASGQLYHDGGTDLAQQITTARVRQMPSGLALSRGRADLVRGVAWCLAELGTSPPRQPFEII